MRGVGGRAIDRHESNLDRLLKPGAVWDRDERHFPRVKAGGGREAEDDRGLTDDRALGREGAQAEVVSEPREELCGLRWVRETVEVTVTVLSTVMSRPDSRGWRPTRGQRRSCGSVG